MKSKFIILMILFLGILVFTNCKKDEESPLVDVHLNTSPDTLIIIDSDTLKELFLSTQPQGKVEYTISQKPEWLSIEPVKGTIDGNLLTLKIKPLKEGLNEGIYKGKISIISNIAGTSNIIVQMSVNGHPKIRTNVSEISFPADVSESNLIIENTGTGMLQWSISNTTKWLILSDTSGYLEKGEKSSVKVKCNRTNLDVSNYTTSLTFISNSETTIQPIPVSMAVPKIFALQLSKKSLLFDYFADENYIYIKNTGNSSFTWSSVYDNYYTLAPNNGTLNRNDSVKIKIS